MSTIPDDTVREVRERADIVSVVADYVSLRKSGTNFQGLCPFHGEKSPSFNVNPGRGIFHCFGCGVGGDVYAFIMRVEGLVFPEAVKFLAKRVGITIEDRPLTPVEKRRVDEKELCYRVTELAAQFYRNVLVEGAAGEPGRSYLARREVAAETAAAYRLGYAAEGWDALVRHLEKSGVQLEMAEKLGLIRRKERGGYYDLFRNRLLFVIADSQGRPIGFGGRVLDDSLPKYINSPESPIYHKSDVLFGLDLAKPAMREQGAAIVVEGYFDHLALFQAGVKNAVATCGTALTPSHLKLLQRYAGKAYTLFDADSAGKKATFRAMELFLEESFPAYVVELTAGEDPDSFLRKEGGSAFAERLKRALPIFEYFYRDLVKQAAPGGIEGRVKVVEELAPRLAKIDNQVERELYTKEIARVLGINEGVLRKRVGGAPLSPAELAPRREPKKMGVGPEEMLLSLMGKYPEVAGRVREYGAARLFQPELVGVAEAIISQVLAGNGIDWPQLLDSVDSVEEKSRLAAFLLNDVQLEDMDPNKAFEQCRMSLERAGLKGLKALTRELAQVDPDSERYRELLQQIDLLRTKKSQLN